MNTQLLNKLLLAVNYKFFEDKTSPGVVLSALKKGYYCSIVRYIGPYNTKEVVCKAIADSMDAAIQDVVNQFVTRFYYPKDPLQELVEFIGTNKDYNDRAR
jgi:hypothetical protein